MYAAIDDPNNQGDLYTSGSETYAQIQPPTALTVSVEINTAPSNMRLHDDEGIPNFPNQFANLLQKRFFFFSCTIHRIVYVTSKTEYCQRCPTR